jgi:integrase
VQEWLAANNDLEPSSIPIYLNTLVLLLDYAGTDPNPARSKLVRLPAIERKQQTAPTADHFEQFLAAASARAQLPLAVLEQTAMRVGELVTLEWGDVDETGNRFRLRSTEVKTRASRWVQVPAWLMTVIAATLPREDRTPERRVFAKVTEEILRRDMATACKTAGVPHYTPHDLRHRRATIWHHEGVPLRVLMERGGWKKSEVAIETYSHAMPVDELPQARLEAVLVRPR